MFQECCPHLPPSLRATPWAQGLVHSSDLGLWAGEAPSLCCSSQGHYSPNFIFAIPVQPLPSRNIPALLPTPAPAHSPSSPQIFFLPISQPCPTLCFLLKCLKGGKTPTPRSLHTDLAAAAASHVGSLGLGPALPCWHHCQDLGTRTATETGDPEQ